MRLTCPLCGTRDRREFYYYGASDYLHRPDPEAGDEAWDNYLHLRDNPAGVTKDLWYHEMGCSAWIEATRNTVTHEILATRLVADRAGSGGDTPVKAKAPRRKAATVEAPAAKPRAPRRPKGGAA